MNERCNLFVLCCLVLCISAMCDLYMMHYVCVSFGNRVKWWELFRHLLLGMYRFFSEMMKKSALPLHNNTNICGAEKKKNKLGKEALVKLLRWHFGHSQFRGKQLEAIEAVLSGLVFIGYCGLGVLYDEA